MTEIDEACRSALERIDGALACGVLDLESRALLGVHRAAHGLGALDERITRSLSEIARSDRLAQVAGHPGSAEADRPLLNAIHVRTLRGMHFAVSIREARYLVVLVTDPSIPVGMGWARLKSVARDIERRVD